MLLSSTGLSAETKRVSVESGYGISAGKSNKRCVARAKSSVRVSGEEDVLRIGEEPVAID